METQAKVLTSSFKKVFSFLLFQWINNYVQIDLGLIVPKRFDGEKDLNDNDNREEVVVYKTKTLFGKVYFKEYESPSQSQSVPNPYLYILH